MQIERPMKKAFISVITMNCFFVNNQIVYKKQNYTKNDLLLQLMIFALSRSE